MELQTIVSLAGQNGWQYRCAAPLSALSTFRIGGPADLLVTVPDGAAAAQLLAACRAAAIPTLLLGNGSNLLIGDKGVRGVTWRFDPSSAAVRLLPDGRTVVCDAGVPLVRLCRFATANALTGLEFAFGIPGSAGGAAYMNAGAYDGQMADVLQSAAVITADGECRTLTAADMAMGYRHTAMMESGAVITALTLQLRPGDTDAITARMQELLARRRDKQPLEYPSAGSFFKRPAGHFAGGLIEQCGLKGFAVGDAAVSDKHAGFVINTGHATAADIRALADAVVRQVYEKTGVTLEPEVRFVGEF